MTRAKWRRWVLSINPSAAHKPALTATPKSAVFGLFNQKPRWSLSLKGWLALVVCASIVSLILIFGIHSFLGVTKRVATDTLVVEGWITDRVFARVVSEFNDGRYTKVYTTGGDINWTSAPKYGGTYAGYSAARLRQAGIPTNSIVSVPSHDRDWERTFLSAVALSNYFRSNNVTVKSLNVITVGPHARRTHLLYQRALGKDVSVGIIALPRDDYDPKHWWRTSTGLKDVVSETAAYLYCRLVPSAFTESPQSPPAQSVGIRAPVP